ncbi:MAG: 3-deoxy-7-phosphoheptulonate synthase class II [Deltaproteobacteria bacterium]|nr:3-deoxy-7-phosphoheptulonate synthase class II [Deltaproteobacteria bacterium]MBT4088284.1 3-deoxy-7-phosphoheptulonate synthase class II [Deltaproteobacteria bacterium]MBT4263132.1 3-deoxy-7-phosphoheptulonate synthase class II [Deltaproteobacteria bacterium]MBT4637332.1 3-deoxy-7-phosphoheptulonate synthase class II [Deltaproteobacteria bacterium]MBT6504812.1 3-deoxy-7-phosphoheptulonate synthase class II [Deltaproteobacteria bacterium]
MSRENWSKDSWQSYPALQQAEWPDQQAYQKILQQITALPPLVFAGEIRKLKALLADAAQGKAFLLQGGDCAEEFSECTAPTIRETMKVILQMAVVLTYAGEKPVIKMGRIAGQYAKPRSKPTEIQNGIELPSFRGDMVNAADFSSKARTPDCQRLLTSYFHSAASLNILRAFTRGGYASLEKVHAWNKEFVKQSAEGKSYETLANDIEKALTFMKVIGFDPQSVPQLSEAYFYTSHEALLLGYEEALTRQDSLTGMWYDCSAHMVWIGDRTRQLNGAHIEYLRGVHNPIGMKIGPEHDIDEIKQIMEVLNPENEWGRMVIITRFGKDKVAQYLPELLKNFKQEGFNVLWSCDPMHGNTYTSESNYKTRNFKDIHSEIRSFFQIHHAEGTVPGGVHFELTGKDVTECVGGGQDIMDHHLENNYATSCDPRLNAQQSLDLAFLIAEMLKN